MCLYVGILTKSIELPLLDETVVYFPKKCYAVLDDITFIDLDGHNAVSRRILVEQLRNLKVTADKPFVIYKCHPKASFGLLVVVYRPGLPPLYLFIDNKSQSVNVADIVEDEDFSIGLYFVYVSHCVMLHVCFAEYIVKAHGLLNINEVPKEYRLRNNKGTHCYFNNQYVL